MPTPDQLNQILADPALRDKLLRELLGNPPVPPQPSRFNWKYLIGIAGALTLGGGTVAGILKGDDITNLLKDKTFSFALDGIFSLLGVTAAVGAVVGIGYSLYHSNWKLPLPRFAVDREKGTLSLPRWGFLDEVLFALAFAVAAVWAKFPGEPPHVFTETTFALAVGAALAGARMRSGYTDRDVLRETLAVAVGQPAAPGRVAAVESAATSIDAARAAMGQIAELPPALKAVFDEKAFRDRVRDHNKPITANGDGLTLGTLVEFPMLNAVLRDATRNLRLPSIAALDESKFVATTVEEKLLDAAQADAGLRSLHRASVAAMAVLKAQPSGWEFKG